MYLSCKKVKDKSTLCSQGKKTYILTIILKPLLLDQKLVDHSVPTEEEVEEVEEVVIEVTFL